MKKWFYKQCRLVQIILLLIPIVSWIVEIGVRVENLLNKKDVLSLVMLLVALCVPVFGIVDLICCLLTGKLLLLD